MDRSIALAIDVEAGRARVFDVQATSRSAEQVLRP
jgi:predicted deacylase